MTKALIYSYYFIGCHFDHPVPALRTYSGGAISRASPHQ